MAMKNILFREALREIRRSKNRFFSILAIVAIGGGFFSGVKAACPDMKETAETYLGDSDLADLHLLSGWGFNEDDLAAVEADGDVKELVAGHSKDLLAQTASGDELVIKAIGYDPDSPLNRPYLHEGRLPEAENECVIGTSSLDETHWEIGETVSLTGDHEDLSDTLAGTEYTVVGIAQLPQYFGYSYGTTSIADGTLDGFVLIPEENFTMEVYTDLYLSLSSTENLGIFSDEYQAAVDAASDRLEMLGKERAQLRFDDTKKEIEDGIADGEKEISDGEKELSDAEEKLSDARKELDDGWESYYEKKADADRQLADAEKQISDNEAILSDKKAQWQAGMDEVSASEEKLADARKKLDGYIAQRDALSAQLSESETQISDARQLLTGLQALYDGFSDRSVPDLSMLDGDTSSLISSSAVADENLPALLTGYITASGAAKKQYAAALSETLSSLQTTLSENEGLYEEGEKNLAALNAAIDAGEAEYASGQEQLLSAKETLSSAETQLDTGEKALEDAKAEYASSKKEADDALSDAYRELTDGENEYSESLAEYNEKRPDAESEIADAKQKLSDARKTLSDLKTPQWYILDHSSFPGVSTIADDAEKVDAIAAVFPVFFVLVAALVCLTTMTRMVEEQRTQIGTLKALGFKGSAIAGKYLLYAASASVLGSVFGCLVGLKLLPMVIINCYKAMYQVPYILTPVHWEYLIGCIIVSVFCTGAVTLATCCGVLGSVPAQLMRPKAPKNGKRILLERVTPLWKRLSFSSKVTCRNLFRYKSRMLMTVIGVAGCTALMLTGFGLRYAISSIATRQFGGVFTYDATLSLADGMNGEELETLRGDALAVDGVENVLPVMSKKTDVLSEESGKSVSSIYLYLPMEPDNLSDFIALRDAETGETLSLNDDGVVITKKLSKLLSVSEGDTLRLQSSDGEGVDVTVSRIAETYINHYVYMTPALYRSLYGEDPSPTALLVTENGENEEVSSALLDLANVQGLIGMSYYADAFSDLVSSLNMIVWVLIASAAALAVIVMYNLVNINVSERERELATIKVLGFYDREVSDYICRENTASALMGMCAGLIGGIWLEEFVVNTAEVDVVLFVHGLPASAFLMAAGLTVLFILLVNRIVHRSLKKIDMVSSLKSVE